MNFQDMTLEERIDSFAALGEKLRADTDSQVRFAYQKSIGT